MARRGTNVVRLQPPPLAPVSFADARALWDRAEIRSCLDALRNDESPESAILSSRCYFRLNRPADALNRLGAASAAILASSDALRGECAVVTATAHFRLNEPELTDAALCEARVYIYSTTNRALEAELDVLQCQVEWSRHELGKAQSTAERVLKIAPTPKWRSRGYEMLGAVAGVQGKYKQQIDFYDRAWVALDEGGEKEPWLRGAFLQVLSGLCNDLYRRDLSKRISEREQMMEWTADTEYMRFNVLRDLARCTMLSGDHIRSFRLLRKAAEIAPSLPWRILIFAERSALACEMNERLFAMEELEQAQSFAATCDWSQVRGEERLALLRLAEVTASTDAGAARALLEIYRKNLPPIAPTVLWANDNRWSAVEAYAFGIVAMYSGDTMRAIERLSHAFSVWRGIDYVWRALDAAIHLSRLTGAAVFREYTLRHAPTFPNTWLARQVEQLSASTATVDSSRPG